MKGESAKRAAMRPWRDQQRAAVIERSSGLCEFEKAFIGVPLGETHVHEFGNPRERIVEWDVEIDTFGKGVPIAWARCGARAEGPGSGLAHIYRRFKNGVHPTDDGPPIMFHELAVLCACGPCHRTFDDRVQHGEVRVPAAALAKAKALIEHTLRQARERGEAAIDPGLVDV